MMKMLPKYIQNMFLAYGADRMTTIAKMNSADVASCHAKIHTGDFP